MGFFTPTPSVDAIEAAGLSRLEPLGDLEAETARTDYADGPWEANVTLFGANIDTAKRLDEVAEDRVRLGNIDGASGHSDTRVLQQSNRTPATNRIAHLFIYLPC